jgi:hypothetical protein
VLRALTGALLAAALPLAALCAPLVHAHIDDHHADHHDNHHDAPVVHSHFSGHSDAAPPVHPDEARLGTHDDQLAISLQVFVAVGAASLHLPVAPPISVLLAAPVETAAHVPVDVVHGHDPPLRLSLPSRAPPAFLS